MATIPGGVGFAIALAICCVFTSVWSDKKPDINSDVEELLQRVARLETVQRAQQEELIEQKRLVVKQSNEIADLKEQLKNRPANDDTSIDEPDITDVSNDDSGRSDQAHIKEVPEKARKQLSSLFSMPKTKTPEGMIKRQAGSGHVAFTAYLDHDIDMQTHVPLVFNQVITNDGGGYSTSTGLFICPQSGVYLFAFFIGGRDDHQASVQLVVNNHGVMDAVVETIQQYHDGQGGNMVIEHLNQGDHVWIEANYGSHLHSNPDYRFTSFTGVLLY